jgi:hypothetical protein
MVTGFATGRGQRSESYTFGRREGASGRPLGALAPLSGANLSLSGSKSLSKSLSFQLGVEDAAAVAFASERVDVAMVLEGQTWPLGRYLYTDATRQDYAVPGTDEVRSIVSCQLSDFMAIIDTELETSFTAVLESPRHVLDRLLDGLPFDMMVEDSPYLISNSWMAGTSRRQVLETVAELGGYLPPWFDTANVLRLRRLFDPDEGVAAFDFDAQQTVVQGSVTGSNSTVYAPNRFVIVSNGGNTYGGSGSLNGADAVDPGPMMAFCDVPSSAPHSIMNIGFVRARVEEMQATSVAQCQAVADLRCLTQTVAEFLDVSTTFDPRHGAWETVAFQGKRWLETSWSAQLTAGAEMRHSLQRAYPPSPEVLSGTVDQLLAG